MVATVPGGFLAGVVVWRVPRLLEWGGLPSDLAATVLMYPASKPLNLAVILPLQQAVVGSPVSLSEYLLLPVWGPFWALSLGYGALTTTFWLTLPPRALGGHIHEQARSLTARSG